MKRKINIPARPPANGGTERVPRERKTLSLNFDGTPAGQGAAAR